MIAVGIQVLAISITVIFESEHYPLTLNLFVYEDFKRSYSFEKLNSSQQFAVCSQTKVFFYDRLTFFLIPF